MSRHHLFRAFSPCSFSPPLAAILQLQHPRALNTIHPVIDPQNIADTLFSLLTTSHCSLRGRSTPFATIFTTAAILVCFARQLPLRLPSSYCSFHPSLFVIVIYLFFFFSVLNCSFILFLLCHWAGCSLRGCVGICHVTFIKPPFFSSFIAYHHVSSHSSLIYERTFRS